MKKTGMIRRIDELGRIVLPKEIRKSMHLKVSDYLEIILDQDRIILKKYSEVGNMKEFADLLVNSIYKDLKKEIMITDKDHIISYEGKNKKQYLGKPISNNLSERIMKRQDILEKYKKKISFAEGKTEECSYGICIILSGGIEVGSIITYDDQLGIDEMDYKIMKIIANFLEKQLEHE